MYQRIRNYIKEWESKCYPAGIPDEAPVRLEQLNKVPSYKQLCLAILKNDTTLKTIGFTAKKTDIYHEFKKIDLGIKERQLKLFP